MPTEMQQIPGVEWSPVSARVTEDLSYEQWEEVVRRASVVGDASRWWLGDLLRFGETRYGERHAQALAVTRLSSATLTRYVYVSGVFDDPGRRRPDLSFSHHREVARLEKRDQDRLLDKAEAENWSTDQIRDAVKDVQATQKVITHRRPRQEILGAERTVDAAATLVTVRESLRTTYEHLKDPEKVAAVKAAETIPPALRALDEAGETLTAAAKAVDLQNALDRAARYYREALTEVIAITHWDVPDYEKIRAAAVAGIKSADHELKEVTTS